MEKNSFEKIKNLMIDSNKGKIPFSYVAEIKSADGPNTISRENVSRRILLATKKREPRGSRFFHSNLLNIIIFFVTLSRYIKA